MAIATDRLLFLHIPKTGGVWLSHVLAKLGFRWTMVGHQHSCFPQLLQCRDAEWFRSRFIFTMIRHPLTWYQSRWAFRVKHGWRSEHPLDFNCASNDFHTFLDNALNHYPNGWLTWLYEHYIDDVPDGIDYVARLENCVEDVIEALTRAEVEFDKEVVRRVSRINDSNMDGLPPRFWARYTPALIDRVMAVEGKVIDRYYCDYEFNPNDLCHPHL